MSLYVHIPFCRSKCAYCDFCSFAADESTIARYIDSLTQEIALAAARFQDAEIETVYFGGGTPSIVPAKLMQRATNKLRECFRIPYGIEFTSEANPGTVTDAWLEAMTEAGMNRLSLGMQSGQERLLTMLGRIHRFSQVGETLQMARRHGIDNLSVDLMYGLPTQTLDEYLDSIQAAADLGVQHISAYALKVEDGTKLQTMLRNGALPAPDDDRAADMMDAGIERLETLGYRRYEISNFAKPGYESQHNLQYWRQAYYFGLGLSAASMLPAKEAVYKRQINTTRLTKYETMLSDGKLPLSEIIPVNRDEAMFETIMLGLRTAEGVSYAAFEAMYGQSLHTVYESAIVQLQKYGWLLPADPRNPHLALNTRGLALQNAALLPFMNEK